MVCSLWEGIKNESFLIKPARWESFERSPLCSSLPCKWWYQVIVLLIIKPRSFSLSDSSTLCPATVTLSFLFWDSSLDFLSSFVPIIRSLVLLPLHTSLLSLTQEVERSAPIYSFCWSVSGLLSHTLSVSLSAYSILSPWLLTAGKSLLKIKKHNGPRRLPWGTPWWPTCRASLRREPTWTSC